MKSIAFLMYANLTSFMEGKMIQWDEEAAKEINTTLTCNDTAFCPN